MTRHSCEVRSLLSKQPPRRGTRTPSTPCCALSTLAITLVGRKRRCRRGSSSSILAPQPITAPPRQILPRPASRKLGLQSQAPKARPADGRLCFEAVKQQNDHL